MKKSRKYLSPYKIPNDKTEEIRRLSNQELVLRSHQEYKSWVATVKSKKNDPQINSIAQQIKAKNEEIKADPRFQELQEEFSSRKEELMDEEFLSLKEDKKALTEGFNSDISLYRGCFREAMDEIDRRRQGGVFGN